MNGLGSERSMDLKQIGDNSTVVLNSVFDASQYAFFGNDVVEEVELGGLEDEEDELPVAAIEQDFVFDKEEVISKPPSLSLPCLLVESVEVSTALSDVDDLASTFPKVN
ncbi:unnamed protein product [Arabis nemorensis]|uniref:Uncharacterized protein n=1 Tax=Arabis nemorensis TaxID=586526 RepID=A0A565ASF4_9BRAS|nr:unnamed protein product [Arabis nemorensis]